MIDYSEEWLFTLLFQVKGSVGVRASMFAIPCALISLLLVYIDEFYPDVRTDVGITELSKSQLWTATTAVLGMLLSFRTNRAMARFWEGTGLLHQMRGEWFDSISCCVTFSVGAVATKRKEVYRFRHTIVRLMSLCHGSALEEIAGGTECVATIDALGLDNDTLMHLKNCKEVHEFNRVEVLLHLTQSIITKALDDGILKIPPPILSRVYQTLSRGFVNLLNAKKIADTRFPFPYAQLIAILLFLHILLTPLMISCLIQSKIWAPLFTFVPIFAMFSVNFIGVELENPFGTDDNDLPLAHFQGEMNKCLMMLLHESADLIANVSEHRCITDFDMLTETMNQATHSIRDVKAQSQANARQSVSDFARHIDMHDTSAVISDFTTQKSFVDGLPDKDAKKKKWSAEAMQDIQDREKLAKRGSTGFSGSRFSNQSVESARTSLTTLLAKESVSHSALTEAPAQPPLTPREAKDKHREKGPLGVPLSDYDKTIPGLSRLVELQVQELSRSIASLTEFSDALPGTLDTMLLSLSGTAPGPSKWRKAMLRRTDAISGEVQGTSTQTQGDQQPNSSSASPESAWQGDLPDPPGETSQV